MDINLQAGSGIEVVRQLKRVLPKTQFLMVTVYQDADHIYEALAAGATGYLLKQTSMDELIEAMEEVHAGGSPMTSVIARKVTQAFAKARPGLPSDVKLSPREQEVLDLLARGFSLKEVADKLEIRMPSVKTYVRRMYREAARLLANSSGGQVRAFGDEPIGFQPGAGLTVAAGARPRKKGRPGSSLPGGVYACRAGSPAFVQRQGVTVMELPVADTVASMLSLAVIVCTPEMLKAVEKVKVPAERTLETDGCCGITAGDAYWVGASCQNIPVQIHGVDGDIERSANGLWQRREQSCLWRCQGRWFRRASTPVRPRRLIC